MSANYSMTPSEDTEIISSLNSISFVTDICYTLLVTYLNDICVYIVADVSVELGLQTFSRCTVLFMTINPLKTERICFI
jgi:hypothetical protein